MPRVTVPAAEEMIGKEIPCLNAGHVMLVDYMGGDMSVTQAARVSYAKDLQAFDEIKDKGLIHYLMAHRHTTPFEMVQIKLRMKLPIFVARQWVRHRTASLNEVSARYTQLPADFYVPEPVNIQAQSTDNKQGRMSMLEDGSFTPGTQIEMAQEFKAEQGLAYGSYEERIDAGMAKELARLNLPVSIYTEWYWNQNLWNMLHLLGLRMDGHAQYEIRVYANAVYEIVKAVAPLSLAAWEEFMFKGARFSQTEMAIIKKIVRQAPVPALPNDDELTRILGKRGALEFIAKFDAEYNPDGMAAHT
jgi:thymidylate synthase (FAD)